MSPKPLVDHTLYYGDNLEILDTYIPDESIDLVYLDPPFNSNRNYNVLFKEGRVDSSAQIHAFVDTWEWTPATIELFYELTRNNPNPRIAITINSLAEIVGHNPMMAYLVNMTARLIPLHRALKPTGSIYLHCDPTASHYLKIILDTIFGTENYRNEIIWKRTSAHNDPRRWGGVHDVLLFYSKSDTYVWNHVYQPYDEGYLNGKYRHQDERGKFRLSDLTAPGTTQGESSKPWRGFDPGKTGRHWAVSSLIIATLTDANQTNTMTTQEKLDLLDQHGYIYWTPRGKAGGVGFPQYKRYLEKGVPIQDVISDITPINSQAAERLGYPTQKPEALLERIINASSKEGDWVLDPFCGCGTSVAMAQRLSRHWIGIDISIQAVKVIKQRLQQHYPGIDVPTDGIPKDYESACALSDKDKFQFQDWALSLVDGAYAPSGKTKRGPDWGIDGFVLFYEPVDYHKGTQKQRKIVVSVKGGEDRKRRDIATLKGDMEREDAPMGIFITLHDPSPQMKREAALAGIYQYPDYYSDEKKFPRVQILTVKDYFDGKRVPLPPSTVNPFKTAEVKAEQRLFPELAG